MSILTSLEGLFTQKLYDGYLENLDICNTYLETSLEELQQYDVTLKQDTICGLTDYTFTYYNNTFSTGYIPNYVLAMAFVLQASLCLDEEVRQVISLYYFTESHGKQVDGELGVIIILDLVINMAKGLAQFADTEH